MNKPRQQVLLVICYPNDWHWALSAEFFLSLVKQNSSIDILDLSTIGENNFRLFFKRLARKDNFRRSVKELFQKRDTKFVGRRYIFEEKINTKLLIRRKFSSYTSLDNHPALNSIIEKIGNLEVLETSNKSVIRKEINTYNSIMSIMSRISMDAYHTVVTVNGRFTKNAAVVKKCNELQIETNLIEFGSTLSKFEVFTSSPHSMKEVEIKINAHWDNAPANYRKSVASEYLSKLVLSSNNDVYGWRDSMVEGSVPKQNLANRCTFFASTEAEYAGGVGDEIAEGNFRNQVEAFQELVDLLPAKDWEIYLRRHPKARHGSDFDPEQFLWAKFENIQNVFILEPESEIDSIALGMSSDLVTNFSSTIVMELAARGFQRFATLGPAPWNQILPKHYTPNTRKLKNFINDLSVSLRQNELYPWAFYVATYGTDFEAINYDNDKKEWFLDSE
jgi:hypothetical protein